MAKKIDYKRAFQKNRVAIVKDLGNADSVADHLYGSQIFTEEMRDEVHQENEREKKNRKILDTLTYRGKRAVRCLFDALLDTENKDLAELFSPYVLQIEEKENMISPTIWPPLFEEQLKMEKDHVIRITDLKHPSFIHEYSSKEVYQMRNREHGKAYIINNQDFSPVTEVKLGPRTGSDIDAKNLYNLFTNLQFDVITRNNLTARGMIEFLKEERDKVNWHEMDCLILVIMSHGEITGIYGQDGNITPLQKLTEVFDSNNCPGLNEKPRLVFVQACRGGTSEVSNTGTGIQATDGTDTSGQQSGLQTGNQQGAGNQESEKQSKKLEDRVHDLNLKDSPDVLDAAPSVDIQSLPKTVHSAADYLIAYATPEGTKAFRNIEVGSWFLNAVVWTFKYHAHQSDIQHLLIKVNELVAKARTNSGDLTVSECNSRLRKKFFFFPGVYGDPPKTIDS